MPKLEAPEVSNPSTSEVLGVGLVIVGLSVPSIPDPVGAMVALGANDGVGVGAGSGSVTVAFGSAIVAFGSAIVAFGMGDSVGTGASVGPSVGATVVTTSVGSKVVLSTGAKVVGGEV